MPRKVHQWLGILCAYFKETHALSSSKRPHFEQKETTPLTNTEAISELAWMAGDWQTAPGGLVQIEEHWTRPAGGSMIGMGRTIARDKMVEFEFLRLEQRADAIYYVASPNAACPATDFKLTRLNPREAVFENPQHDFPKRITYTKKSDGSLVTTIDAGEGTRSQSFVYVSMSR